jgi:hypothetical protein
LKLSNSELFIHIPKDNATIFAASKTNILELEFIGKGGKLYFVNKVQVSIKEN